MLEDARDKELVQIEAGRGYALLRAEREYQDEMQRAEEEYVVCDRPDKPVLSRTICPGLALYVLSGWLTAVQGTKASSEGHVTKRTRNKKKSSPIRSRPPRRRLNVPYDRRLKPLRPPLPQLLQHDAPPRPPKITNTHIPSPSPRQRPRKRRIRRYLLQQTFKKGWSCNRNQRG